MASTSLTGNQNGVVATWECPFPDSRSCILKAYELSEAPLQPTYTSDGSRIVAAHDSLAKIYRASDGRKLLFTCDHESPIADAELSVRWCAPPPCDRG